MGFAWRFSSLAAKPSGTLLKYLEPTKTRAHGYCGVCLIVLPIL
jgi:hypothetical protein